MIEVQVRGNLDGAVKKFSWLCKKCRLISDMRKAREFEKPSLRDHQRRFRNKCRTQAKNERIRQKVLQ